jgi:hypothetical protein
MAGNRMHTIAGIFFEYNIYLKTVEQEVGELIHLPRRNSTRGEHPSLRGLPIEEVEGGLCDDHRV